jgi:hypothetical protein
MTARRRSGGGLHGLVAFIQRLIEALRHARNGGQAGTGRGPGDRGRNPWPQCPICFRRVPALCADAEEGAEPCFLGVACGCCTGPHLAKKDAQGGEDGGKFKTSVQAAGE